MSDSSSKLIQRSRKSAPADGQKASLKIGERVPVATGSFQPGIGGVGINPLVNTQFNYIDVGVNIDITPRVHGLDEVTLKLTMDISAVDSYQNIGGIQQPVIGQRKIEQEIRLREGEVNILGGILESDQTKSLSGIPGLASDPALQISLRRGDQTGQRQRNRFHPDSAYCSRSGLERQQRQSDRRWHRQYISPASRHEPGAGPATARRRNLRSRPAARREHKSIHRSRRPVRRQRPARSLPPHRLLRAVQS